MTAKHWAEDSIKRTIPLAGIPGEKIEYKTTAPSQAELQSVKAEKAKEKTAEKARRGSQMDMFDTANMTKESIAEMNEFLDEKVKSFGTHPDDEKEEAEDVKLIKKMVKKPALKDNVSESVTESFNIGELSFVKTSPITASLAEAIAMVMEAIPREITNSHQGTKVKIHNPGNKFHGLKGTLTGTGTKGTSEVDFGSSAPTSTHGHENIKLQ